MTGSGWSGRSEIEIERDGVDQIALHVVVLLTMYARQMGLDRISGSHIQPVSTLQTSKSLKSLGNEEGIAQFDEFSGSSSSWNLGIDVIDWLVLLAKVLSAQALNFLQ